MQILLLSNEYPPNVYGGAGVHVGHLTQALAGLADKEDLDLKVNCFGDLPVSSDNPSVVAVASAPAGLYRNFRHAKFLDVLYRNVIMIGENPRTDLIHCHTWYTYLAGCLLRQITNAPLLVTVHSLEPRRPWKKEQLGTAYYATSWLEKTALQNADGIIAVSMAMARDITGLYDIDPARVRVIYNGIDSDRFRRVFRPDILEEYGIDPAVPYILFVGRITHQKGILHLVNALRWLDKGVQVVLCAGAPDTPAIAVEMENRVQAARSATDNAIVWIGDMVPESKLIALYSHAALFVCPSIYEPFGIINLEAMACGVPVVATAVGGIPEVVVQGQTGLLVPFEPAGSDNPEPKQPEQHARVLADAINTLLRSPEKRAEMGAAARKRVDAQFGWNRIAEATLDYYGELIRIHSEADDSRMNTS